MRAIDGDTLKEQLQNLAYDDWNQGVSTSWADAYREVADMVEDAPTIEPVLELDEWCMDCKEYDHDKHCCPRFNRVIRSALQDAEPDQSDVARAIATIIENEQDMRVIERTQQWIPCSERLPSESGRYIVTYPFTRENNWLNIMYFGKPSMPNIKVRGKCWYIPLSGYGDVVYDDILAWMPLPEPYKGEQE